MYEIKMIEHVSEDRIKKAIEMDHAAFKKSDWITEEDANLLYHNKKDCLIWLAQDDEPIGFVTIFPLSKTIPIKAVETNKPIYKLLTQDILSEPNTDILYCHCFLILPRFRGRGLIYKLYDGLKTWLEQKGTGYSSLYADAVSPDGQHCLERLGFASIHSFGKEGVLYKADKKVVINAIAK
jgi:hypothetical protein